MKQTARTISILAICLLMLNAIEEVVVYKVQRTVANGHIRTIVLLGMFTAGFALVAAVLVPWTKAVIRDMHKQSGKQGGLFGILIFYAILAGAFYWLYYTIYVMGPENLLPAVWR